MTDVTAVRTGVVRGKRRTRGARRYLPGGWSPETLPVQAFAVEHPDGVCLFDAGQTAAAAPFPGRHPFHRLSRFELEAADELQHALDPARVRWLVLSHLHTDHVGSVGAFPAAEVVVSRVEWRRARGVAGRMRGYTQRLWPAGLAPRLVEPGGPPLGPFPATLDLAGDGRLLVVPTPGHTPGHLSLVARTGSGSYLLAGDLVHTAVELLRVAPAIAEWCEAENVTVLAAHDPAAAALLGA